ncbi:MAG: diadenosine tetraphosphate hydrolase [Parcubacteria group bacterium]|jgi:8-oxo-dGTP pyrophosphatase MutT (NUDIX family)|nr:diadenosine tetraphosphate hydrolase [Parcubacteria group bacterium]|tara:strand:+ start:1895 stop:2341 length:447 start_codon:yes stop_codon:yes gene_type:complete
MIREKTIGVIIFKRQGKGLRYLLLHHGGSYWNFPKGRQEGKETELQSALRELSEETGINKVDILDGFRDEYNYDFDSRIKDGTREKVYKKAIFFIGEVIGDKVKISDEHIDFDWYDFDTCLKRLFFQEGQDSLKRAHQFLLSRQDIVL